MTITDANGEFRFNRVEAGAYRIATEASGFYSPQYEFTLRARQPVYLTLELTPKLSEQQGVEVRASYETIDPQKTGSSQTLNTRVEGPLFLRLSSR